MDLPVRKTYPGLDGIVCLTKTEKKHYERLAEAFVIPNFTQQQPFIPNDPDTNTILTVAGLIPRKGIDMLLEVASRILEENKDWKWKLIGDGELRKQVEKFISDAKLQDHFIRSYLSGHDISNEYCKASLFVLTSRFEALPMVLLEALSFGVPCVSFDCPSGPFEIIINNVNGKIVENGNTYEMKEAITEMISDHSLRKTMRQQAWESSKRYSPDRIYELWKKLF